MVYNVCNGIINGVDMFRDSCLRSILLLEKWTRRNERFMSGSKIEVRSFLTNS